MKIFLKAIENYLFSDSKSRVSVRSNEDPVV